MDKLVDHDADQPICECNTEDYSDEDEDQTYIRTDGICYAECTLCGEKSMMLYMYQIIRH